MLRRYESFDFGRFVMYCFVVLFMFGSRMNRIIHLNKRRRELGKLRGDDPISDIVEARKLANKP